MASVSLKINGQSFRLECGDGEEHRLVTLVEDLQTRVNALRRDFGAIGTDRLLLMAALMLADELFETRAKMADLEDAQRESEFA